MAALRASGLAASATILIFGWFAACAEGPTGPEGARYSIDASWAAESSGAEGALLARAAQQAEKPDDRARLAPLPPGFPADILDPIPEPGLAKAYLSLDEVVNQWPDPMPEGGAEQEPPTDEEALEGLRSYVVGRAQRLNGELEAAESNLKMAARLDPRSAPIWRELSALYFASGNRVSGMSAVRRTLELDPLDVNSLDIAGRFTLDRREYAQAAEYNARLLRRELEAVDPALRRVALARLGRSLLELGYLAAGCEALRGALDLPDRFGQSTNLQVELGWLYRERSNFWRDVGDTELRLGRLDEADAAYQAAANLPNLNPAGLLIRRVYTTMKRGEPARATLLVFGSIRDTGGRADEPTVSLLRHIAAHSDVGRIASSAIPWALTHAGDQPAALREADIARIRAALLPDREAMDMLLARVVAAPADDSALRELMSRAGATPELAIATTLRLIDAAPLHEERFAQSMVATIRRRPADALALVQRGGQDTPAASLLRARLRAMAGDLAGADTELASLLEKSPDMPAAITARIGILMHMGDHQSAQSLVDSIAPDGAAPPDILTAKARALAELGQTTAALDLIVPLIEADSARDAGSADRLLIASSWCVQLGEYDRAVGYLDRLLELDPGRDDAYAVLIALYGRGGAKQDEAKLIEVVQRLREADPSSPTLRWLRAQEAAQRGQVDLAKRDLLDLAAEYPGRAGVVEALVRVWIMLDQKAEAESWLVDHAERWPGDPVYLIARAELYELDKRADEGIALLDARLAENPGEDRTSRALEAMLRRHPEGAARAAELARARLARGPRTVDTALESAEIELAAQLQVQNDDGPVATDSLSAAARICREVLESGRPMSPAASARLAKLIFEIGRYALVRGVALDEVSALQKLAVAKDENAPIEIRLIGLRILVRGNPPLEDVLLAIEEISRKHPTHQRDAYSVAVEELAAFGANQRPRITRYDDAMYVLGHACSTIKPLPLDLLAQWIGSQLGQGMSSDRKQLRRAIELAVSENQLDETVSKIAELFKASKTPPPPATIAHELAVLIAADETGGLSELLYRCSLRFDPRHIMSNNNLGYNLLVADREIEEAHRMIEIAYEGIMNDPGDQQRSSIIDSLGWARYKLGIFRDEVDAAGQVVREGAITLLMRAYALSKTEIDSAAAVPIIADHLADAHWSAGEREKAIQLWREAERLSEKVFRSVKQTPGELIDSVNLRELRIVSQSIQNKLAAAENGAPPPIARSLAQPTPIEPAPPRDEPAAEAPAGAVDPHGPGMIQ